MRGDHIKFYRWVVEPQTLVQILLSAAFCVVYSGVLYALDILQKSDGFTKTSKISKALWCAKIYLKMGNMQRATDNLKYVIYNGNKLYDVTEAKELLTTIEG